MDTSDEKNANFKFDDFISKIVPDPANPVGHTLLRGFIGASTDKDHVRVYADESLNSFIDIPQRAIVYTKELSNSPLGGSSIWVKSGTEYVFGRASSARKTKKKFFDGPVYQEYITANLQANIDDESISFQYCMTSSCTSNCSESCPTFQYCHTNLCPTGYQNETIYFQRASLQQANLQRANNFKRIADDESISFQYCMTSSCTSNCSESCPTFQYCHTNLCPTGDQNETVYFQRANLQQANLQRANNFRRIADEESISFQYCMTSSCTSNCSDSCPTFQYCHTNLCPTGFETDWYQRANGPYQNRFAGAAAARGPIAGKGGFNPYRGY